LVLFIDANVPIYASGRAHPLREPCRLIIRLIYEQPDSFATDAEVLQELLHRYLALNRWLEGRERFVNFAELMRGRVEPIYALDVEEAARLAGQVQGIAARDLLHVAVMRRLGIDRVVSADRDYDRIDGVTRLDPAKFDDWREQVGT
jgi:predicted nucleic acid-binding protein